jgi:hypothetical protein
LYFESVPHISRLRRDNSAFDDLVQPDFGASGFFKIPACGGIIALLMIWHNPIFELPRFILRYIR